MDGGGSGGDFGERLSVKAVVAGVALLYAAALAAGVFDGPAPPKRAPGDGALAVAAPAPGLCFRGPRGEPVDFSADRHCGVRGAAAPRAVR